MTPLRAPLCLALLVALSACPGPDPAASDGGFGDGSCLTEDSSGLPEGRLVVATEQYGSGGGITIIDLETLTPEINVALTSDDVTPRWFAGRLWVLNRYGGDNVTILTGQGYGLVRQISLRPQADLPCNPHDLAFVSTCRVYLSCYDQASLYRLDPTAPLGEVFQGAVDLSSLADGDGLPELSHLALVGDRLFVAVERLDRQTTWGPVAPSYVAVVDPEAGTLEGTIPLEGQNPVGPLRLRPGTDTLWVTVSGAWDGVAAGLEVIDTATRSASTVLTAEALGGIPTAFTVDAAGCGFAVVSEPGTFETGVVRFCASGAVSPCLPLGEREVSDVALSEGGRLFVTDRDPTAPGIRVYDPETCDETTTEAIPTGFAPGFTNPLLLIPRAE